MTAWCDRLAEAAAAVWQPDAAIRIGMPLAEAVARPEAGGRRPEQKRRAPGVSPGTAQRAAPVRFQHDSKSHFQHAQHSRAAALRAGPGAHAPGSPGELAASGLFLELADPLGDRAALELLATWCQRFGPSVALEEGPEPQSLLVDVTGIGALEGGEAALAERVLGEFHQRGLSVRIAIADTLAAAWAVARYRLWAVGCGLKVTKNEEEEEEEEEGNQPYSPQPTAHSLSSPPHSPPPTAHSLSSPPHSPPPTAHSLSHSLSLIPPGESWAAIAPLPIAALRLPEETCALLAELGLGASNNWRRCRARRCWPVLGRWC